MKNLIVASLLFLHLFNQVAFLIIEIFLHTNDSKVNLQFDRGKYNKKDLTEIKIPLQLPYSTENTVFQRVEGSIDLHGISYNYIGRKIKNDTLYIFCIADLVKTQLVRARSLVSQISEPGYPLSQRNLVLKFLLKSEYIPAPSSLNAILFACQLSIPLISESRSTASPFKSAIIQPPELFV